MDDETNPFLITGSPPHPEVLAARPGGPVPPLSPRDRRNTLFACLGDACWGLGTGTVASGTVLVVILTQLGAGKKTIGFIGAIEGAGYLLTQALGPFLFRNRAKLKAHLLYWHLATVIPFLPIMGLLVYFSPKLSPVTVRVGLLLCWAGFTVAVGVVIASWIDWLAQVYDRRTRGTTVGLILAASFLALMAGQLVASWLIARDPSTPGYARHYLLATLGALASIGIYALIDDPGHTDTTSGVPRDLAHMAAQIRLSLADKNMRGFLSARGLGLLGFLIGPFLTIYYTSAEGGALSPPLLVSCGAAGALGAAAGVALFGRAGDRFGHRAVLLAGTALQVVTLTFVLCGQGPVNCAIVFALAGLAAGAAGIAQFNLLMDASPHESRVVHIVAGNLALAPAVVLGPLAAGAFADYCGLRWLFGVSLVLSVIALGWCARWLRETPRRGVAE